MNAKDMQKLVERLSDDCFEAHRGAFWWQEDAGIAVAFGNDGYASDPRAKGEVQAVRRLLDALGGEELAFATDAEDGYSWALACRLDRPGAVEVLEGLLWQVWLDLGTQM